MLTVTNLSKSFANTKALSDLSFSIKKGEIIGLLGPNGAGKTTTMRLLTGFLYPDKGEITLGSISVTQNPLLAQQKIGYLPENNPLYPEMLVSEFLNLCADLKQIPPEKLKSSLNFVVTATDLEKVYHKPINTLSKGFRQRVGLAAALLHKPQLLILDEPTEGLDPNQRQEIRQLIKKLSRQRTIITSTHVMQEATAICTRLLIINQGKLIADATPQELTQTSTKEKQFHLKIQGQKIISTLKTLPGLKNITTAQKDSKIVSLDLSVSEKTVFPPLLAELSQKNHWIIWELHQKERLLEDVFHELTTR